MHAAFYALRQILSVYANRLVVVRDDDREYYLDTRHIGKNKKPTFFASVRYGKQYVSCYLMPIYVYPELASGVTPALERRRQGKSCFNFKRVEPDAFAELESLIGRGYKIFQENGYVP